MDLNGVVDKVGEEVGDGGVDVQQILVHQVLDGVVGGVHLGVGRQVVQGVGGDGGAVGLGGAVGVVGVHSAPGVGVDHLTVLDDGQLGGGEAVVNVVLDHGVDQVQGLGVQTRGGQGAGVVGLVHHGGVVDCHGEGAVGVDVGDAELHAVAAVAGHAGHVHSVDAVLAGQVGVVHLHAVDEDADALVAADLVGAVAHLDVQGALALIAVKPGAGVVVNGGGGAGGGVGAGQEHIVLVSAAEGGARRGIGIGGDPHGGQAGGGGGGAVGDDGVDARLELLGPGLGIGLVLLLGHVDIHKVVGVLQGQLGVGLGDLAPALLGDGHHQVHQGEGVVHVGGLVIGVGVLHHQADAVVGHLEGHGVHSVHAGAHGVIDQAHHGAQTAQDHVVGVEVVGVNRVVNNGGVLLVGQQHHNQVVLGVNDGEGAGPALVADGGVGGLDAEVAFAAQLGLPPPAQAPGGSAQALGLGELVHDVLAEELVAAVAAGQHDGGQLGQVLGVGEQTGVAGDAAHGVVGLLVVDLALDGVLSDILEADNAVAGVAVELGGGAVVLVKAVLEGIVGDVGQAHGVPEGLLQELVQAHAGDLLDDEAQQHVVHVGVDGLAARLIGQGRGQHHLEGGLTVLGEQGVGHALLRLLGDLIELVVVVLGIGVKAGLVHQDVPDGQLGLPLQDLGLLLFGGALLEDGLALVVELGEELGDGVVQGDVVHAGALGQHVLQGVVDGVHLGVGRQVVQGVGGDGNVVLVVLLNPGAVGVIAVDGAPGVGVDHLAVLHHGQLGAGEAVLHLGGDEVVDDAQNLLAHAHVGGHTLDDGGVGDADSDSALQSGGGDGGDLNGVGAVDGQVGDVHLVGVAASHDGGVHLGVVDEQTQAGDTLGQGDVQLTLIGVAVKAVQAVHGQGIIHIPGPVGEGDLSLPVLTGQGSPGHTAACGGCAGAFCCCGRRSQREGQRGGEN